MTHEPCSYADILAALERLSDVVNNHADHIRHLGQRLNDHEQAIMLMHELFEQQYGQPEPRKSRLSCASSNTVTTWCRIQNFGSVSRDVP